MASLHLIFLEHKSKLVENLSHTGMRTGEPFHLTWFFYHTKIRTSNDKPVWNMIQARNYVMTDLYHFLTVRYAVYIHPSR